METALRQNVKKILSEGLGIRPDIRLAYYLNAINETNGKISDLESKIKLVLYNQENLDRKLRKIISLIEE